MIRVKNSELNASSISAIKELSEMDISVTQAFKLMKVIKELDSIIETRRGAEEALLEKYAKRDENGNKLLGLDSNNQEVPNTIQVDDSRMEDFNNEKMEFMDYENTLSQEHFILDDLKLDKISAATLLKVGFLFE